MADLNAELIPESRFREPLVGKEKRNSRQEQKNNINSISGFKPHYIVDYFAVIDFAIYNRYDIIIIIIIIILLPWRVKIPRVKSKKN